MSIRLPHEISASIVAGATAFLTVAPLHLPTWAIFITWAGTFLMGGPSRDNARSMLIATTTGSVFGVVAIVLATALAGLVGGGQWLQAVVLAVVIFAVNATLLATGRLPLFSLIPGMFFGFASVTATYFGGFGFVPGNLMAAFVSSAAMCALGPLAAYLGVRLMQIGQSRSAVGQQDEAAPA